MMVNGEKKSIFIFCCIVLFIVSKVIYNLYMPKVMFLAQYISNDSIPLASAFIFICLVVFTCLTLIVMLYLYCLWHDIFRDSNIERKEGN